MEEVATKAPINISYFCPAYNEEENIEELITQVVSVLSEVAEKFEIIIINNGSTDRTPILADKLASKYKEVRVLHFKENLGYGGALEVGFKNAIFENIVYTDADLQYDISDLKKMIPPLQYYDIINGLRKNRAESLLRRFQSRFFNALTNLIFRLNLKDINCSFKLYKKKVIDAIDMDIISKDGYFIDGEMLAKAKWKGFKTLEVQISHRLRAQGRGIASRPLGMMVGIVKTLRDMTKVYRLKNGQTQIESIKA